MVEMKDGVLYVNGEAEVALSADYPYYRDSVENWEDRIIKLKRAGMNIITFYVPWRHHHVQRESGFVYDFTGHTEHNRNVLHFIELIHKHGMYAIIKPGPFIHAEVDFGGLPDFVEGGVLGEPMLDAEGNARYWHRVLPAPMDRKFDAAVRDWLTAVRETVLRPHEHPKGPIIAVQLLNEGLYSDGQYPPTAYDYSESGLRFHSQRLHTAGDLGEGETAFVPRKLDVAETKELSDLVPYLQWSETQNAYLAELYRRFGTVMQTKLPMICNLNPPLPETRGFDYWLTRVVPEKWPVHYGFTNWIGVVSHDETAFLRYLLLVKRARGVNLEENWGFSKLYDSRYRYHQIPFYQTLLALGLGATGFNVYTGVSTDSWTDDLDTHQEHPYPDSAPITETGEVTEKYHALELLATLLQDNRQLLLHGKQPDELTFALYPPYNYLGSFVAEDRELQHLGVHRPQSGHHGVESFMLTCVHDQRPFGLVNIETATIHELLDKPLLVMVGAFFLAREVQHKLMEYVERGGRLLYFGEVPHLDDKMQPCTDFSQWLGRTRGTTRLERGEGVIVYQPDNPFAISGISPSFSHLVEGIIGPSAVTCDTAYVFRYRFGSGSAARDMLFILSQLHQASNHKVSIQGKWLEVRLPAKGSAILVLGRERVCSALIKGISDYDKSYATPRVQYAGHELQASNPCDWLYQNGYETVANVRV
ncbi:beta-galactosidase [Alicyclobacillus curvatus]|nr:beta-galactosidase [Alicyclobacillus curvatus]